MRPLADGESIEAPIGGGTWLCSWHGPARAPEGTPHGAGGLCITSGGDVVLITNDGERWDAPAGRPEPGETLEQTLVREVMEEACARVTAARLLGYSRGACIAGAEAGLVLIRSLWWAEVEVLDWTPRFETKGRRIETAARAWDILRDANPHTAPLFGRWFVEAGLAAVL
jgi:8-oxo-dGTP pyrophosphatase MutT (NUDIX family)